MLSNAKAEEPGDYRQGRGFLVRAAIHPIPFQQQVPVSEAHTTPQRVLSMTLPTAWPCPLVIPVRVSSPSSLVLGWTCPGHAFQGQRIVHRWHCKSFWSQSASLPVLSYKQTNPWLYQCKKSVRHGLGHGEQLGLEPRARPKY